MVPGPIKKRIKFSSVGTITDYIDADHLPEYINGGTSAKSYRQVPPECRPTSELISSKELAINHDEQLTRVKKYYEKLYDDFKTTSVVSTGL